jgi:hypothetical protein
MQVIKFNIPATNQLYKWLVMILIPRVRDARIQRSDKNVELLDTADVHEHKRHKSVGDAESCECARKGMSI